MRILRPLAVAAALAAVLATPPTATAATEAVAGNANFTFKMCPPGSDHVAITGTSVAPDIWQFRLADVNPTPTVACVFAGQTTVFGTFNATAGGCVGAPPNQLCFAAPLALGPNSVDLTLCSAVFFLGLCLPSDGPALVVLA